MDKQESFARFELAANFYRDFTQSMIMAGRLPVDVEGRVKFIGGRLLKPEELKRLEKQVSFVGGWAENSEESAEPVRITHGDFST